MQRVEHLVGFAVERSWARSTISGDWSTICTWPLTDSVSLEKAVMLSLVRAFEIVFSVRLTIFYMPASHPIG
jgi:hypothetical protein